MSTPFASSARSAFSRVSTAEALFGAVGRRRLEQARGAGFVFVLRRDAVGIRGLRAEAARAVVGVGGLEVVSAVPLARHVQRDTAGGVVVGVVRQPGQLVGLQVVACVVPQRVLGAAGRGVALEALGVGEELARGLGVAVRRRDGVALAVVAVGLRRFEHEADVREVRVVGVVVIGAVDRDVLDHQVTPLRDDDPRRVLPVREVVVEARVLVFSLADLGSVLFGVLDLGDEAKVSVAVLFRLRRGAANGVGLAPAGEQERRRAGVVVDGHNLARARAAIGAALRVHGHALAHAKRVLIALRVAVGRPEVRRAAGEGAVLHQVRVRCRRVRLKLHVVAVSDAVRRILHDREAVRAGRVRRERDADLLPAGVHLGDRVVIDELALPRRRAHTGEAAPLRRRQDGQIDAAAGLARRQVARVDVA